MRAGNSGKESALLNEGGKECRGVRQYKGPEAGKDGLFRKLKGSQCGIPLLRRIAGCGWSFNEGRMCEHLTGQEKRVWLDPERKEK